MFGVRWFVVASIICVIVAAVQSYVGNVEHAEVTALLAMAFAIISLHERE